MIARVVLLVSLSAAVAAPGVAQGSPPAPVQATTNPQTVQPGPVVGDVAPDFTGVGADKGGTLKDPVRLADLKGKTVVLALFPRARTSGCTMQLTSYRDQYATLFNGGKDVVLLAISNDADTTLTNWAKDANFPFKFVSDKDGSIGRKYGSMTETSTAARRFLYVIAPDGKIVHTAKQFQPARPSDYTDLGDAIKKAMGAK